jgi:transposase-like protein
MAKARKKRMEYTAEQREKVLAAAKAENLTAAQVQKKFGVTPVTYYSWRKKSGVTHKRGTRRGTRPVISARRSAPRCRTRCGRSSRASCAAR